MVLIALPPVTLCFFTLVGLAMHRHASPLAISVGATVLVFGPGLMSSITARRLRAKVAVWTTLLWSLIVLGLVPVYFPGERRHALIGGLALLGAEGMDSWLQQGGQASLGEPFAPIPRIPVATPILPAPTAPPPFLPSDAIALPYEGEGRHLSVPVVFKHKGQSQEFDMMLDTGATYTTLPTFVLDGIGAAPDPDSPILELHTANGTRQARLSLIDSVWMGDLELKNVAVAACDECATTGSMGLLGLNVAGRFNLTIDADQKMVIFAVRPQLDRTLDIKPFVSLDGSFQRFPGGRVEVEASVDNQSGLPISGVTAGVHCNDDTWAVLLGPIGVEEIAREIRVLPRHEPCETYELTMQSAQW